jgi:hypothetical protein
MSCFVKLPQRQENCTQPRMWDGIVRVGTGPLITDPNGGVGFIRDVLKVIKFDVEPLAFTDAIGKLVRNTVAAPGRFPRHSRWGPMLTGRNHHVHQWLVAVMVDGGPDPYHRCTSERSLYALNLRAAEIATEAANLFLGHCFCARTWRLLHILHAVEWLRRDSLRKPIERRCARTVEDPIRSVCLVKTDSIDCRSMKRHCVFRARQESV